MNEITRRSAIAGSIMTGLTATNTHAQPAWPKNSGTIRLIVPFPAGGSVDAVTRLVQPGLQTRLGATLIIENQGGSSGSIGAARVAKSAPDGNTWLFVFDSHAVNPAMQKLSFDTVKDLDPVMLIGTAPNALATHPSRPFRTLQDVIAAAKAKPDSLTYATIGTGSLGHLTMVRVSRQVGIKLAHVPYRGGGPAMNDAIAGHVDMIVGSAALLNPQLEAKGLRPLVQFSAARAQTETLRDVPTATEAGLQGVESNAWWGVFAPAGTPKPITDRFGAELAATLRDERVARTLTESQQITLSVAGPEEFQRFFLNEMQVWGTVVREGNIKADS